MPVVVLLVSIYLVVGPIIDSPQIEYLYATMFIVAGLIFYFPLVYMKLSVPGMGEYLRKNIKSRTEYRNL